LPGLSEGVQLAAFRIIQEGLTNVLKHAGPQVVAQVQVRISEPDGGRPVLLVELNDNGVGPGQTGGSGHGLIGIRERVALFGGEAAIGTGAGPDGGFRIRATLPVAAR
jgi:signal transduction histidine kinase